MQVTGVAYRGDAGNASSIDSLTSSLLTDIDELLEKLSEKSSGKV